MALYRRLFIDFDSFYASVEQQDNEDFRNKPLIVVPCLSDYTCAIAASYQAKRLGVKTGTRVSIAKEKIPGIIVCEARPKRYVEIHNKILENVDKFYCYSYRILYEHSKHHHNILFDIKLFCLFFLIKILILLLNL